MLGQNNWQKLGDVRLRGQDERLSAGGRGRSASTQPAAVEHRGMKLGNVRDTFTFSAIQITSVAMTS